ALRGEGGIGLWDGGSPGAPGSGPPTAVAARKGETWWCSIRVLVCGRMKTPPVPARRPCAGAGGGPVGALLGGYTPPAAVVSPRSLPSERPGADYFICPVSLSHC